MPVISLSTYFTLARGPCPVCEGIAQSLLYQNGSMARLRGGDRAREDLHSGHSGCCSATSLEQSSHMVQWPHGRRVCLGASRHTIQSLGRTFP